MLFYRNAYHDVPTRDLLARLIALRRWCDLTALLVEAGELEQGIVDALHPHADGWDEVDALLRALCAAAARAYLAALDQRTGLPDEARLAGAAPHLNQFEEALQSLTQRPLPETIRLRPPEGYVQYALNPAGYAAAAQQYIAEVGAERAVRALVVGVRTIGTSLSAIVAAATGASRSVTVRPRGETGSRHIMADDALGRTIRAALAGGGDALIVDEGPGATGETLACVAQWLERLGAPPERIVLFPSRTWGMPLAPPERRDWFARTRVYGPAEDAARPAAIAAQQGLSNLRDLSAGQWRLVVPGAAEAVANPGHERIKWLGQDAHGARFLLRYAGLGSWGAAAVDRARALADAGLGPPILAGTQGFVTLRWIPGRPATPEETAGALFHAALERYLADRAPLFRTDQPVDAAPLVAMLRANAEDALGADSPECAGLPAALRRLERLPALGAVIPDARLHPREWVRTEGAAGSPDYLKVDAIDHGDGLRLPGPTGLAWDLAGAAMEYALPPALLTRLVERCAAATGESAAWLSAAVAAYPAPYAACQLGDALLASWEATHEADRRRLEAEAARYRTLLAAALSVSG